MKSNLLTILCLCGTIIAAKSQQKLWTWTAPKEVQGGVVHAAAVRADGMAGMLVGKVTDAGQTMKYHVVMIDPKGCTGFTAAIPTTDSFEDVVGMYGTKWQLAVMGESIVVSDGEKLRIFTKKGGKVIKKILSQKGTQLFSRSAFNGWLEKTGPMVTYDAYPDLPGFTTMTIDSATLWKVP